VNLVKPRHPKSYNELVESINKKLKVEKKKVTSGPNWSLLNFQIIDELKRLKKRGN